MTETMMCPASRQPRLLHVAAANLAAAAAEAAAGLGRGLLVVFPTDTVYGIAADPSLPEAVARLYEAKRRPADKPIPLLASGVAAVHGFGARLSPVEQRLAERFWPGPLTLVLPVGDHFEGFRVPNHDVALAVLEASGSVLRVTSANLSGEPPALEACQALSSLGEFADMVLDSGPAPGGEASTVVKVEGDRARVLRPGVIAESEIREGL